MCLLDFQHKTGTQFPLIPYRGVAPVMQDLLAGQIDLSCPEAGQTLPQFRAGSITLAGDKLLVIRESGEMILAPASPQAFKPIARAQILPGVVRPLPAVADGFVYVRNDNTLVCLDLRR